MVYGLPSNSAYNALAYKNPQQTQPPVLNRAQVAPQYNTGSAFQPQNDFALSGGGSEQLLQAIGQILQMVLGGFGSNASNQGTYQDSLPAKQGSQAALQEPGNAGDAAGSKKASSCPAGCGCGAC